MFPDIVRDDVFRLETPRLWLRWPRCGDAAAIELYCSKWEVARHTARIPHPYPKGGAERYIYAAREANTLGQDLRLALTPISAPRLVIGLVSLERCGDGRLTLGYALAPEAWGRGLATEAVASIVGVAFALTQVEEIKASVHLDNPASGRVLAKNGFRDVGRGLRDAPARGAMIECDDYALTRERWKAGGGALALERA